MDSDSLLHFPKLSGPNYRTWATTMRLVLASKSLLKYIDNNVENLVKLPTPAPVKTITSNQGQGETPEGTPGPSGEGEPLSKDDIAANEALRLGNARAMLIIAVKIGTEQLSFVATARSAYDQWLALRDVYEPAGMSQLESLLAAFYGYTMKTGYRVIEVSTELTTIQSDIRSINKNKAPSDGAKLFTLTELLLRSNVRYKNTVLMIRSQGLAYEAGVLMLREAEYRILASDTTASGDGGFHAGRANQGPSMGA